MSSEHKKLKKRLIFYIKHWGCDPITFNNKTAEERKKGFWNAKSSKADLVKDDLWIPHSDELTPHKLAQSSQLYQSNLDVKCHINTSVTNNSDKIIDKLTNYYSALEVEYTKSMKQCLKEAKKFVKSINPETNRVLHDKLTAKCESLDSRIKDRNKKPEVEDLYKTITIGCRPTPEQKALMRRWATVCNFIYNSAIDEYPKIMKEIKDGIRPVEEKKTKFDVFRNYMYEEYCGSLDDEKLLKFPLEIRDIVNDVSTSTRDDVIRIEFKNAISDKRLKNKLKPRLGSTFSLTIRGTSIKSHDKDDYKITFCPNLLSRHLVNKTTKNKETIYFQCNQNVYHYIEPSLQNKKEISPIKLTYNDLGQWLFHFTVDKSYKYHSTENYKRPDKVRPTTNNIASLDMGVRTFATLYSTDGRIMELGNRKPLDVLTKLDNEIDRFVLMKKAMMDCRRISVDKDDVKFCNKMVSRTKRKLRRLRQRKQNIRKECHLKLSNFLCQNFTHIIIGKLTHMSIQQSMKKKGESNYKMLKDMKNLGYNMFYNTLIDKSKEYKVKVNLVQEHHTSKTCGGCGWINENLGSSKVFQCEDKTCGSHMDRDHNAARNILIRNNFVLGYP